MKLPTKTKAKVQISVFGKCPFVHTTLDVYVFIGSKVKRTMA